MTTATPEASGTNQALQRAREAGAIPVRINTMAIPLLPNYQRALRAVPSEQASLRLLRKDAADRLDYKDGKPYLDGRPADCACLESCLDDTGEAVKDTDPMLILFAYSLVLDSLRDSVAGLDGIDRALKDPAFYGRSLKYYVPELLQAIGIKPDSRSGARTLAKRFRNCRNVMGFIPMAEGPEYHPALVLTDYDPKLHVIEFTSPYLHRIALLSCREGILLGCTDIPIADDNGQKAARPAKGE